MASQFVELPQSGGGGGSGITSINSDTTAAQLIVSATSGTDISIATSGGTTTVAIPSASATARGVVTTGAQTIAGAKTLSSAPILSALSASQAVVTNGSKALASLAYTDAATASTLVSRDASGNSSFNQVTSSVSTGTAPLVVASTTNVANLNASSLGGATFAAPGAIGGGTPSSAAFTTISASGQITSTLATGTAPFAIASTTQVANLNAATAGSATTATNIAGGAGGSIPYQSAAATTAMLANGTVGQVLVSAGGTSPPTWATNQSSGTLSTMQGLTGVDGQEFWNTTYKAKFVWVTDRWYPLGYIDKRYGFYVEDEFLGSDRIGQLDWQTNAGLSSVAAGATSPGVYQLSNSTASSIVYVGGQFNAIQIGTADIYYEAIIQIPTLSDGTNNAVFIVGFSDLTAYDAAGKPTDGVYFTLDRAVDTTHWNTNTCSNGTNTQKTSVIAAGVPAAGTYYRMGIYINAGTSATFYVNGTAITAAHTTNLPSGAGRQTGMQHAICKTLGSGALTMLLDSVVCYGFFNGARVS